jgi:hypothetical protein
VAAVDSRVVNRRFTKRVNSTRRSDNGKSYVDLGFSPMSTLLQVHINAAFLLLRRRLPSFPVHKKMSKQEILRTAIRYISILQKVLANQIADENRRFEAHRQMCRHCFDASTM